MKKANQRQIGIVISKKVGNAVMRNYVKRVIRELYRKNRNSFSCHFQMIVIPSKKVRWDALRFKEIESDWMQLIEKIDGLC